MKIRVLATVGDKEIRQSQLDMLVAQAPQDQQAQFNSKGKADDAFWKK